MRVVTIENITRGTLVGDRVQFAGTSLTRMVGLLGKHSIDAGEGLWIRPSSGVHTFGMRFAIDVIGLDGNLKVVQLWPSLRVNRVTKVSLKMRSAIELRAGQIEARDVRLGDELRSTAV